MLDGKFYVTARREDVTQIRMRLGEFSIVLDRLATEGVLVTQATSPFFAPEAFWCIVETIKAANGDHPGLPPIYIEPYHVHVPSFGEWGFVMAAHKNIQARELSPSVPTRYLNTEALSAMFSFGGDMQATQALEVNRLDQPVVYTYYRRGWRRYNQ